MSFEFVKKLMDSFSMEDFTIIKLMEEIAEIEQEISLKKKAMENRLTLLRRLLQKHENEEIKTAIQSFLMRLIRCSNLVVKVVVQVASVNLFPFWRARQWLLASMVFLWRATRIRIMRHQMALIWFH